MTTLEEKEMENQQKRPEKVTISIGLFDALMQLIYSRPYGEVHQVATTISQEVAPQFLAAAAPKGGKKEETSHEEISD